MQNISEKYETSEAIVAGIRQGDRQAETALITKFSKSLYLMLLKRTGNPDLTKDLQQDTFIVVLEKLRSSSIDDPSKLSAYIHRTAINLYIGDIRKQHRRKTSTDTEMIEQSAMQGSQYLELTRQRARAAVKTLIAELANERDRSILRGYYIEERGKELVCQDLNLSHRHFDRVISRARVRFKQLLNSEISELVLEQDQ